MGAAKPMSDDEVLEGPGVLGHVQFDVGKIGSVIRWMQPGQSLRIRAGTRVQQIPIVWSADEAWRTGIPP